jgi:hypothetical protein
VLAAHRRGHRRRALLQPAGAAVSGRTQPGLCLQAPSRRAEGRPRPGVCRLNPIVEEVPTTRRTTD